MPTKMTMMVCDYTTQIDTYGGAWPLVVGTNNKRGSWIKLPLLLTVLLRWRRDSRVKHYWHKGPLTEPRRRSKRGVRPESDGHHHRPSEALGTK